MAGAPPGPVMVLPVLQQGTTQQQSERAIILNCEAGASISGAVRTTLGPMGMDKMLVDAMGKVLVSNDGVTILKELDVEHPAAKMVIEASKAQDEECGDGTTTVCILTGELLSKAIPLLRQGIHPLIIQRGYAEALRIALLRLDEIAHPLEEDTLLHVAQTAMTGKSTDMHREHLANLVMKALQHREICGNKVNRTNIRIIKMRGKGVMDTQLVHGLTLHKTKATIAPESPAGGGRVLLLQGALKPRTAQAEIRATSADELDRLVKREAEQNEHIIKILTEHKVKYVFASKDISDDVASIMSSRGMVGWRRCSEEELTLLSKVTGAFIISNVEDLHDIHIGWSDKVEELTHEEEAYVTIKGSPNSPVKTFIIQASSDYILDETERSIHDALITTMSVIEDGEYVHGGGAPYMDMARVVLEQKSTGTRSSYAMTAFAEALRSIPRQLAENSGMDPIDAMLKLEASEHTGDMGVDVLESRISPMLHVVEPERLVRRALIGATETACTILRIDDVIQARGLDPEDVARIQSKGGRQ